MSMKELIYVSDFIILDPIHEYKMCLKLFFSDFNWSKFLTATGKMKTIDL
jgi:hypothetical protein